MFAKNGLFIKSNSLIEESILPLKGMSKFNFHNEGHLEASKRHSSIQKHKKRGWKPFIIPPGSNLGTFSHSFKDKKPKSNNYGLLINKADKARIDASKTGTMTWKEKALNLILAARLNFYDLLGSWIKEFETYAYEKFYKNLPKERSYNGPNRLDPLGIVKLYKRARFRVNMN